MMTNTPDQLAQAVFDSARDAVAERVKRGAEAFTPDDVEALLRSHSLAWYARGSREALAAVLAAGERRDAGALN
jgi:hypothetical protein